MKIKKNELLFFIGIILLILKTMIEISFLFNFFSEDFCDILLLLSYVVLMFCIFRNIIKFNNVRKLFFSVTMLIIALITYYISKYTGFLTLIIVLLAAQKVELDKTIRILFLFNIFIVFIHIAIYIVNLVFDFESLNIMLRVTENTTTLRHAFCFKHPNIFAMYVFWTTAMYYYLNYERLDIYKYFITVIIAICIYFFPNSRTCCLAILMLIIFTIFEKKRLIKNKFLIIFFTISLIICIMSLFLIDNQIISLLDEILSNRLALGHIIYEKYGLSLLGTDIQGGTGLVRVNGKVYSSVTIIDSTFYSLLLNYGVISFVFVVICVYVVINKIEKRNFGREKVMIFVWIIYALSETSCMSLIFGFPLFFINKYILEGENNEK